MQSTDVTVSYATQASFSFCGLYNGALRLLDLVEAHLCLDLRVGLEQLQMSVARQRRQPYRV